MTTSFLKTLPAVLLACTLFSPCEQKVNSAALTGSVTSVPQQQKAVPSQLKPSGWGVLAVPSHPDTIGNPWFGTTSDGVTLYNGKSLSDVARRDSSKRSWAYSFLFPC